MPDFDWDGFLDLADELVGRRGNAAAERTAISRAYYAAFHPARAHLVRQGERLTLTGADHGLVWRWFLARPDPLARAVGTNGRRLVDERRRADYDPIEDGSLSVRAAGAVRLARQVIANPRRLP